MKNTKISTNQLILKKKLFGGYSAYYKEPETKASKFADNIKYVIYHGDMITRIDKNIGIVAAMSNQTLDVEYIQKTNKLVVSTIY